MTLPKPTPGSPLTFTTTYAYGNWDSVSGLVFTTITDPNDRLTKQGYDSLGEGARVPAIAHVTRTAGCVAMMALAGCLACRGKSAVRTIGTPEVSATPVAQRPTDYRAWCDLLAKALAHSASDKAYVDSVSSRTPSTKIGLLARVLLEEWDMTPGDTRLSTPRAVHAPTPGPSGIEKFYKGKSPLAIVEGVVGSDGFVRDLRVLRPSGYQALNDTCLARLRATRFRPARVGNAYVPTKLGLLCNLDVQ